MGVQAPTVINRREINVRIVKTLAISSVMLAISSCGPDKETEYVDRIVPVERERSTEASPVTDKFGELKVKTGSFTYESEIKPWSSHWYPSRDKELFYNPEGLSPLEKYDEYTEKSDDLDKTNATLYEKEKLYNESSAEWAGLCHAWAVASVLHKEPMRASTREKIKFSVGDKKALIIKSYEGVTGLEIYGDRYDGDVDDNYKDIYPDQFHKFVMEVLGKNKKPFLMDYDSSYPVWTVPVYKVKFDIEKISNTELNVSAWVTFASQFVDKEYVGTRRVVKSYYYTLSGRFTGDTFVVEDGEWIKGSKLDHPDYVIDFPKNAVRKTFNEELNSDIIDKITSSPRRE